jgi:transcriptional regulator GlxA family with amidase domain
MSVMNRMENERDRVAIDRLLRYMDEHCTEPFDAKKHASLIFFSESKLNKVFKVYVGIGPGAYFRRLRIQKAMQLYQQGIRSWTEVSHIVGYADLPSFSKAFKKITGATPNSFTA